MPFCRFCGAPKDDENAVCSRCNNQPIQYCAQPVPRQEDEAGKVIGIVLLVVVVIVVVTVILAAILYVMVIGFSGEGTVAPAGAWTMQELSNTSGKITFNVFTGDVAPTDICIYVQADGVNMGHLDFAGDTEPSPADMNWVGGPAGAHVAYTDYNPAGGRINSGDNIVFTGLEPGVTYSFEVYHFPSDMTVTMAGQASFTTDT
jgi:hypothetical protein